MHLKLIVTLVVILATLAIAEEKPTNGTDVEAAGALTCSEYDDGGPTTCWANRKRDRDARCARCGGRTWQYSKIFFKCYCCYCPR
uniref:Secreted salivary protein n=1 Tax=Culicoides nubeculosus TaxID=144565 RepID=B9URM4_CULNU|nr:secreted salivary protein [Culicoides nubeculosus]